jgi:hypothetical protein
MVVSDFLMCVCVCVCVCVRCRMEHTSDIQKQLSDMTGVWT